MKKRNYKEEIKGLRERVQFERGLILHDLTTLELATHQFNNQDKAHASVFYKFLPIATMACFETFLRQSVQSLVDKGAPYFDRLEPILGKLNQRLDFDIITNLQKQQFTLGEFISHLIPCNSLNDVEWMLSTLLETSFMESVKNYRSIFERITKGDTQADIAARFEEIKKSIAKSFERRHVFCHEAVGSIELDSEELLIDLHNWDVFLRHAGDFIGSLLYENWGLTPHEQVDRIFEKLRMKEESLAQKIEEVKTRRGHLIEYDYPDFEIDFAATMESFENFSKSKAKLLSDFTPSATWSSHIYAEDRIRSLDFMIENLS